MNNWKSLGLIGFGILLSVSAFWRYFVMYTDRSQGLSYILLGCLFIIFGLLYSFSVQSRKENRDLKDRFEYVEDKFKEHLDEESGR